MKYNYLALFLLCLVFSCNSPTSEKGNKSGTKSGNKKDLKVFRYNQPSSVNSLDPAFSKDQATMWIANQIYNGLVQVDENLNVLPCLAKSWDISEDGLSYTFHLNEDVYFHEHEIFENKAARNLKASDVVYSFQRILDPAVGSPGTWIFSDKIAGAGSFVALDDYTFQLKLTKAFRPILGILSMQYCSVIPEKIGKHFGKDFRANPIGSGPFRYKNWREGEVLIMDKNPEYWEKDAVGNSLPKIDGIRVEFNENKQAAYFDFVQNKLDFISGIDPSYKDDLLTQEGKLKPELSAKINLDKSPYLNTEYLGFLMDFKKNPILEDKRIRQAMNYGFDRAKMIKFLRNNTGSPATAGFVPKGLPSFNAKAVPGYSYNPKKAAALLKEAGYGPNNPTPEIMLETTNSYLDLCTFIQNQLKEIGVNVRLEQLPPAALREKMSKSESMFFRGSWIADYPDAESFLTILYGAYPAPPNYTRFNNPEFDKIYQEALLETDDQKRYGLYQQMDRIVIEEAPVIPLYYDEVLRFKQKRVKGLKNNAMNLLILKNIELD